MFHVAVRAMVLADDDAKDTPLYAAASLAMTTLASLRPLARAVGLVAAEK
jgi:hypothetical protein